MLGWSPRHVSQELRNWQRPKGHRQRLSFQERQHCLYQGLPEDARGSVSDRAEEVKEPKAAEVVAGELA